MRCIKVESGKNHVLTVENKFLCFKRITKYQSDGCIAGKYYRWLKLPEKTLVSDQLSFQLDAWLRNP